jgi:hypothetical protein
MPETSTWTFLHWAPADASFATTLRRQRRPKLAGCIVPVKEKSRRQHLKEIERALDPDSELSPRSILVGQMLWFDQEAEAICTKLIAKLKEQNTKPEVLQSLWRECLQFRRDAIDCASKAAKFVHPALEAVSVKQESVHRYCIVAPRIIEDTNEWLKKCQAEMASKAVADDLRIDRAIEHAKLKNSSHAAQHIEEDENPLDEIPE